MIRPKLTVLGSWGLATIGLSRAQTLAVRVRAAVTPVSPTNDEFFPTLLLKGRHYD